MKRMCSCTKNSLNLCYYVIEIVVIPCLSDYISVNYNTVKLSKSSLWYENTFSIHIKTWILYILIYGGSIFFIFHKKVFQFEVVRVHIVGIFIRRSILSLVWLRLLLIFFMKIMQYVMKNKVVTIFVFRLKYRMIYQSKYLQMMQN